MAVIQSKRIFVAWKQSCTRCSNIASHFRAQVIYISYFGHGNSIAAKIGRYFLSFFATFKVLYREQAETIFLINNPPFLMTAVYLYTRVRGGSYILDSHSGPFNDPKWRWYRRCYRRIAGRALLNINTNIEHKHLVETWGGRSEIISDVPIDHACDYPRVDVRDQSIMVICSFMFDEPIKEILEAARMMPDVQFYMTGDPKAARRGLLDEIPANIVLTGYIPQDDYFGLMKSVQGVMVLTKRDNTMQRGAYEALSVETPIITSDWEILRCSFGDGAVYVDNSPKAIQRGVEELIQYQGRYRKDIGRQRRARRERFDAVKSTIEDLVAASSQYNHSGTAI